MSSNNDPNSQKCRVIKICVIINSNHDWSVLWFPQKVNSCLLSSKENKAQFSLNLYNSYSLGKFNMKALKSSFLLVFNIVLDFGLDHYNQALYPTWLSSKTFESHMGQFFVVWGYAVYCGMSSNILGPYPLDCIIMPSSSCHNQKCL